MYWKTEYLSLVFEVQRYIKKYTFANIIYKQMILELYKASLNDGGRKVFSGLSFLVNPGERIAVVGGSCGDRTQLLQVLLGLRRLDSGWACL